MDKQSMIYSYNAMPLNNKKEWPTDTCIYTYMYIYIYNDEDDFQH